MLICTKHCIAKNEQFGTVQIAPGNTVKILKKVRNATKLFLLGHGIVYLEEDVLTNNFKEISNEIKEKKKTKNNPQKLDS